MTYYCLSRIWWYRHDKPLSESGVCCDCNGESFLGLELRNIILSLPPYPRSARENTGNMQEPCALASPVKSLPRCTGPFGGSATAVAAEVSTPARVICLLWKQCHGKNTGFRLGQVKIQILVSLLTNSMTLGTWVSY